VRKKKPTPKDGPKTYDSRGLKVVQRYEKKKPLHGGRKGRKNGGVKVALVTDSSKMGQPVPWHQPMFKDGEN